MKLAKYTAFILALVMLCATLTSCKKEVGAGSENTETLITVGSYKVTYDEYAYFYKNYKAELPSASDTELKERVLETLKSNRAIEILCEKYDVKFTAQQEEKFNEYFQSIIDEQGGREGYEKFLSENNLTGDVFRHVYRVQLLEQELRAYMTAESAGIIKSDDATFEADLEKNFYAAKQILIRNDKGDSKEKNAELAQNILARLNAGEEFDTLMDEFSEDSVNSKEGYYFTHGQLLPSFEELVKNTPVDALGAVVAESEVGYHIIYRLPLSQEYIEKHYEDLRECYLARCFNEIREKEAATLEIKEAKALESADFTK